MSPRVIRVAVVDDEPTMRAVLEDVVSGHRRFELVGSASTADEAIELAIRLRPDVILLDVRLPGGGPHAARGIIARSPGTSVVAISAHADRHTVSTMEAAGAHSYLVKGSATALDIVSTIERAAVSPDGRSAPPEA